MSIQWANRIKLLAIVALFCSPLLLAWYFSADEEIVESRGQTNFGTLIVPARPLPNLKLVDPLSPDRVGNLHGKWTLFYVSGGECGGACEENLYRMRQIRLTTGEQINRVQRVMFVYPTLRANLAEKFENYAGQWVVGDAELDREALYQAFIVAEGDIPLQENRLYIVDPLGNLMMYYSADTDPKGIIRDLAKLIRASRIG